MVKNKLITGISVFALVIVLVFAGLFFIKNNKKSYSAVIYPALYLVQSTDTGILRELYVKPGDEVKRGQLVAEIEIPLSENSRLINKKAGAENAEAALKQAEVRYENAASMYKDGVISQEDYDDILAELKTAQISYKNAVEQEKTRLSGVEAKPVLKKVYSNADGTVKENLLSKGTPVKSGQDILQITQGSMKITAYVDKNTLATLERGQGVLIKVPEYKGKMFNGSIDGISQNPFNDEDGREPLYKVFISFDSKINSEVFTPSKDVSVYFLNNKRSVF